MTQERLADGLKTDRSCNPHTGRPETIISGPDNGAGAASGSHQNDSYPYDSLGNLSGRWQLMGKRGPEALLTPVRT